MCVFFFCCAHFPPLLPYCWCIIQSKTSSIFFWKLKGGKAGSKSYGARAREKVHTKEFFFFAPHNIQFFTINYPKLEQLFHFLDVVGEHKSCSMSGFNRGVHFRIPFLWLLDFFGERKKQTSHIQKKKKSKISSLLSPPTRGCWVPQKKTLTSS